MWMDSSFTMSEVMLRDLGLGVSPLDYTDVKPLGVFDEVLGRFLLKYT